MFILIHIEASCKSGRKTVFVKKVWYRWKLHIGVMTCVLHLLWLYSNTAPLKHMNLALQCYFGKHFGRRFFTSTPSLSVARLTAGFKQTSSKPLQNIFISLLLCYHPLLLLSISFICSKWGGYRFTGTCQKCDPKTILVG